MGTTADKLNFLLQTKSNLKSALIEKGQEITDDTPFSEYPYKVLNIPSGGGPNIFADFEIGKDWIGIPVPEELNYTTIGYGNGRFVILTPSDKALYSDDGITWNETTAPTTTGSSWAVIYANGRFVAVGYNSNQAMYSDNGINWNSATLPSSNYWYDIIYANGKFIAVSTSANVPPIYSTDGIIWNSSEKLPINRGLVGITYGNGKIVAISDRGQFVDSIDGVNWTLVSTIPINTASISYGNGKFVALPTSGVTAYYSEDALEWTETELPYSDKFNHMCFGGGVFVAFPNVNNTIVIYSTDGVIWKKSTTANPRKCVNVYYGDGKIITVHGTYSPFCMTFNGS